MSCWIVKNEVINQIVTHLSGEFSYYAILRGKLRRKYSYLGDGSEYFTDGQCQELAQDMLNLNCAAYNARYNDEAKKVIKYEPCYQSLLQIYKSLQCWLYQCCEGDIPEQSELYQIMQEIKNSLADRIIYDLPEYADATWG